MIILAIDTATDETSAALTKDTSVLSNIVWSQASLHSKWGGVFPSLAKREHEKRIGWVVEKALKRAFSQSPYTNHNSLFTNIDAIAVTAGPGLAIALEVGINYAKKLAREYEKPLIAVNHIEGHVLSPLTVPFSTQSKNTPEISFPSIAVVASGGTTQLILVRNFGDYEIIANTQDDALGEALDKAARMLGLGYPGGAVLEKIAKEGDSKAYALPLPMQGRESEGKFSYSGLKTAMMRLVNQEKPLTKTKIQNLAASFQDMAFEHFVRVSRRVIQNSHSPINHLLIGGGVGANVSFRKKLQQMAKELGIKSVLSPYSKKLYTDNAAMIGIAAYFKFKEEGVSTTNFDKIDRTPRARITEKFTWEKD